MISRRSTKLIDAQFPSYDADPQLRRWNLWGYIDERDVAQACRLGLEADITANGSNSASFIIAAADTVMTRPSADLMREVYPGVPLRGEIEGYATLLSIGRASRVSLRCASNTRSMYQPSTSGRDSRRIVSAVGAQSTTTTS